MKSLRYTSTVLCMGLAVACLHVSVRAQTTESKREPAAMTANGSSVRWQPSAQYSQVTMTVSAPDGQVFRREFQAGSVPEFFFTDKQGNRLPDGQYTYELRFIAPQVRAIKDRIAPAPDDSVVNEDEDGRLNRRRNTGDSAVQSGSFALLNGVVYAGNETEPASRRDSSTNRVSKAAQAQRTASVLSANTVTRLRNHRLSLLAAPDQVIADDLIVQGSACVGLDCVNNESFGFDTIRLKENNTRIKFDDTSTGAGVPANDWQLTANDSASGGSSKFSIEDITGSKVPFTVTAGASTNSIFVDSTGRVGFRTSTPVLDLHVATSNTPALRLEQNNSGGFTAQTWDIAGNEANFFVRDVTGGSRLPFRIRPGAPTSSIDISASGNVGVGTASPSDALHVTSSDAATSGHGLTVANPSGTGADRTLLSLTNGSGAVIFKLRNSAVATAWQFFASNSFQFDNTNNSGVEMNLDPSGNMTILGTLTQGSSREIKEGFGAVSPAAILQKVVEMPITTWVYKNQDVRHIGPMAEDFYGAFQVGQSPKGISPTDTAGVAFAAIQGLNDIVQQKEKEISELKASLDKLEAMITSQQQH